MTKYKTAKEHFLANIIVRIVELHKERRFVDQWIRTTKHPAESINLKVQRERIARRINFLSGVFNDQCAIPIKKANF